MNNKCSFVLAAFTISLFFGGIFIAHVSATVPPSTISSDTIWTKAGSPYELSGPVRVDAGVTLTIEAGATVNLGTYYLQVNGTLNAKGTSLNPIYINGAQNNAGAIKFTPTSASWNERTGSGCIIQNSQINQVVIVVDGSSVKVADNTFSDGADMQHENVAVTTSGGSSIISNNHFKESGINIRDSSTVANNIITGGIGLYGGTPFVSGNTISGGSSYFWIGRSFDRDYYTVVINCAATISGNNIAGSIIMNGYGSPTIQITGNTVGGSVADGEGSVNVAISNNKITGGITLNTADSVTINNNLIVSSDTGIEIGNGTVRDNTIAYCKTAILVDTAASPEISGNNLQNSGQYNLKLQGNLDVDASNNYWGTVDQQAISNSIYDSKNDFNLGAVNFVPFLTAANPDAPVLDYTPVPSVTSQPTEPPTTTLPPSASPTGPTQQPPASAPNEAPTAMLLVPILVAVIVVLVAALIVTNKNRLQKTPAAEASS